MEVREWETAGKHRIYDGLWGSFGKDKGHYDLRSELGTQRLLLLAGGRAGSGLGSGSGFYR